MPERTGLIAQMRRGALEYRVLALLANRERYGFELVQNLAEVEGYLLARIVEWPPTSLLPHHASRAACP